MIGRSDDRCLDLESLRQQLYNNLENKAFGEVNWVY